MKKQLKLLIQDQQKDSKRIHMKPQYFKERKSKIFEAIKCPRKRAIAVMYFSKEFSLKEIGLVLNVSKSTIRYHLKKIKKTTIPSV